MEQIKFVTEDGEEVLFFVEEQTKVNGTNYLLVSDSQEEEADAYILKEVSAAGDAETTYVMVEDDTEFDVVADLFASLMDEDTDLEVH